MSGEMPSWKKIQSIMSLKRFPVVVERSKEDFPVLQQVYPLIKSDVYKIMKCKDLADTVIILFGSALTMRCNSYSDLDICCYHIQQTIEKVLKCSIETKGCHFSFGHNISKTYAEYCQAGWQEVRELELMAGTITDWEVGSRCKKIILCDTWSIADGD